MFASMQPVPGQLLQAGRSRTKFSTDYILRSSEFKLISVQITVLVLFVVIISLKSICTRTPLEVVFCPYPYSLVACIPQHYFV